MTDIKWEQPPADMRGGRNESWGDLARALRDRPREWALASEDVSMSMTTAVHSGRLAAFRPAGHFEAKARRNGATQRGRVWVRYVGGDQS